MKINLNNRVSQRKINLHSAHTNLLYQNSHLSAWENWDCSWICLFKQQSDGQEHRRNEHGSSTWKAPSRTSGSYGRSLGLPRRVHQAERDSAEWPQSAKTLTVPGSWESASSTLRSHFQSVSHDLWTLENWLSAQKLTMKKIRTKGNENSIKEGTKTKRS